MFLRWKVWAFVAGSGLAVAGLTTQNEWLLWSAIAVLFVGMGLRFAGRWKARPRHPTSPEPQGAGSSETKRRPE